MLKPSLLLDATDLAEKARALIDSLKRGRTLAPLSHHTVKAVERALDDSLE